jgi:hypothetical protein
MFKIHRKDKVLTKGVFNNVLFSFDDRKYKLRYSEEKDLYAADQIHPDKYEGEIGWTDVELAERLGRKWPIINKA